jgi:hypothetical protein
VSASGDPPIRRASASAMGLRSSRVPIHAAVTMAMMVKT